MGDGGRMEERTKGRKKGMKPSRRRGDSFCCQNGGRALLLLWFGAAFVVRLVRLGNILHG